MNTALAIGNLLVALFTIVGLIVHCLADKKRFVRKDGK